MASSGWRFNRPTMTLPRTPRRSSSASITELAFQTPVRSSTVSASCRMARKPGTKATSRNRVSGMDGLHTGFRRPTQEEEMKDVLRVPGERQRLAQPVVEEGLVVERAVAQGHRRQVGGHGDHPRFDQEIADAARAILAHHLVGMADEHQDRR